jgi:hypothetical protein
MISNESNSAVFLYFKNQILYTSSIIFYAKLSLRDSKSDCVSTYLKAFFIDQICYREGYANNFVPLVYLYIDQYR